MYSDTHSLPLAFKSVFSVLIHWLFDFKYELFISTSWGDDTVVSEHFLTLGPEVFLCYEFAGSP